MRIAKSTSYTLRRSTTSTLKVITGSLTAIALLAGSVLTYQNIITPNSASAATPPDSCFAFDAGTITDYYDTEGNTPELQLVLET